MIGYVVNRRICFDRPIGVLEQTFSLFKSTILGKRLNILLRQEEDFCKKQKKTV